MKTLEEMIRELIRAEVPRLVRAEALTGEPEAADDSALREQAQVVASRLRRARSGAR